MAEKNMQLTVSIQPLQEKSFVLPQTLLDEHRHSPIKVVTYYNDRITINVYCKKCKEELAQKIYRLKSNVEY